jgi:hypothetical protein
MEMAYRSVTREEMRVRTMVRWLDIRAEWRPDLPAPTDADIAASALFERLMAGGEPLPYPPPLQFSRPWYAIVEDPEWQVVGHGAEGDGACLEFRSGPQRVIVAPGLQSRRIASEVMIFGQNYSVVAQNGERDFVVRDGRNDTPYLFRLRWEPDHVGGAARHGREARGAWLMRSMAFECELEAAA